MATLAPLSTPSRRVFGVLDDTKLRNLQSLKNRQNAVTPNSAPSLKRRAVSPNLSDSENVDPNLIDSLNKRKRGAFDDDVSLSKPSRYNVFITPAAPASKTRVPTPSTTLTPRLDTLPRAEKTTVTTPLSAPPAAGRSPTRGGSSSNRRMGLLQPRKHRSGPSSSHYGGISRKPTSLSITAALNGTLGNRKARKAAKRSSLSSVSSASTTIEESKPNSWFFDIFEESEETQDYRMNEWTMTQSAIFLEISDDERNSNAMDGKSSKQSKQSGSEEERGKENVDPNQIPTQTPSTGTTATDAAPVMAVNTERVSRKDAMLDEPRTPLGDLNPSEFYAAGLDATSVVLVAEDHDDDAETVIDEPQQQSTVDDQEQEQEQDKQRAGAFTFESSTNLDIYCDETAGDENVDINTLLSHSKPTFSTSFSSSISSSSSLLQHNNDSSLSSLDVDGGNDENSTIEIWESESAKDENENAVSVDVDFNDTVVDEGSGFALQEL